MPTKAEIASKINVVCPLFFIHNSFRITIYMKISIRWQAWFYPLLILTLVTFIGSIQAQSFDSTIPNITFSTYGEDKIRIEGFGCYGDIVGFLYDEQNITSIFETMETKGDVEFIIGYGEDSIEATNCENLNTPFIRMDVKTEIVSEGIGHRFGFELKGGFWMTIAIPNPESLGNWEGTGANFSLACIIDGGNEPEGVVGVSAEIHSGSGSVSALADEDFLEVEKTQESTVEGGRIDRNDWVSN